MLSYNMAYPGPLFLLYLQCGWYLVSSFPEIFISYFVWPPYPQDPPEEVVEAGLDLEVGSYRSTPSF